MRAPQLRRAGLTRKVPTAEALRTQAEALLSSPSSHYLKQSVVTTRRGGFTVFGSPYQPAFWGAFNVSRRSGRLAELWSAIPAGTDVVMTHGPAAGEGDFVPRSREHVGCEDLRREVRARAHRRVLTRPDLTRDARRAQLLCRVWPAVAVAGHVHEGHGVTWANQRGAASVTAFVNASTCSLKVRPFSRPSHLFRSTRAAGVLTRLAAVSAGTSARCLHAAPRR